MKQFVKEKGKSKGMIVIGKHSSDGRTYLTVNTKIKVNRQMKDYRRDAIINFFDRW